MTRGSRFETGSQQSTMRGRLPDTYVGNVLYHTVGNREDAVKQISTGFATLQSEIMTLAGWRADPYHPAEGPIWDWWRVAGLPTISAWQAFQAMQMDSFGTRWATDWDTYRKWLTILRGLRKLAHDHGLTLKSPEPDDLSATIWEDIGDVAGRAGRAAAGAVGDVWGLAKIAVYGGLGLVGAIAVGSLVSNLKSGKDPAENYLRLARSGAKAAKYA